MSAPWPISWEISSRCPLAAERCMAVLPILSLTWSCSVDLLNRILTTSEWPFSAARWRGMEPCNCEIRRKIHVLWLLNLKWLNIWLTLKRAFVSANQSKLSASMETHNLEQLNVFFFFSQVVILSLWERVIAVGPQFKISGNYAVTNDI